MSSSRRSRILSLLAKKPMNIISLTNTLNENFQKGYTPSLIGSDIKVLMSCGLVTTDTGRIFSLTSSGVNQFKIDTRDDEQKDQKN